MIVIAYKSGRLGNRLVQAAQFIPLAIAGRSKIVNLTIDEYAEHFVGPSQDVWCRYPVRPSRLRRLRWVRSALYWLAFNFSRVARRIGLPSRLVAVHWLDWADRCYLDSPEVLSKWRRQRFNFIHGWNFLNPSGVAAHASAIRSYFALRDDHAAIVEKHMREVRRGVDVVVGVHIRHGDYRTIHYYVTVEQYAAVMRRIRELFRGKTVRFMVCSDEVQPLEALGNDTVPGPGDALTDLYALAQCDYLVGPHSTFSMWASFYGEVPLHIIDTPGRELTIDDFVVDRTLTERPLTPEEFERRADGPSSEL